MDHVIGYTLSGLGLWLSKTPVSGAKDHGPQIQALEDEVNALFLGNPTMWIDQLQITGGLSSAQVGVLFHDGDPYPTSIRMGESYLWLSKVDTHKAIKGDGEPVALLEKAAAQMFHEHPQARIATWHLTGGRGSLMVGILCYAVQP